MARVVKAWRKLWCLDNSLLRYDFVDGYFCGDFSHMSWLCMYFVKGLYIPTLTFSELLFLLFRSLPQLLFSIYHALRVSIAVVVLHLPCSSDLYSSCCSLSPVLFSIYRSCWSQSHWFSGLYRSCYLNLRALQISTAAAVLHLPCFSVSTAAVVLHLPCFSVSTAAVDLNLRAFQVSTAVIVLHSPCFSVYTGAAVLHLPCS